jgi:hypothetical protein
MDGYTLFILARWESQEESPMRTVGAFTLHIEPASGAIPPRVAIVLANVGPDDQAASASRPVA